VEVRDKIHALSALNPGKPPDTHRVGECVSARVNSVIVAVEICCLRCNKAQGKKKQRRIEIKKKRTKGK
jgi:hypothetical protein